MAIFDSVKNLVQSSTELKVKTATDDDENSGATGTLMSEISVLTYSPKTLKEVVSVLKKRLNGYGKKSSHRNCIHILKTLTLIMYLIDNGSLDFIRWCKGNIILFEVLSNFEVIDVQDEKMGEQIIKMSQDIYILITNEELLQDRRHELNEFRSSISSPGRKSTDNSHLRRSFGSNRKGSLENNRFNNNNNMNEIRRSTSSSRNTSEYTRFGLDPLREEDNTTNINNSNMNYINTDISIDSITTTPIMNNSPLWRSRGNASPSLFGRQANYNSSNMMAPSMTVNNTNNNSMMQPHVYAALGGPNVNNNTNTTTTINTNISGNMNPLTPMSRSTATLTTSSASLHSENTADSSNNLPLFSNNNPFRT